MAALSIAIYGGAAAQSLTTTYGYDALGRLKSLNHSNSQGSISWNYDDVGNRTSVASTGGNIAPQARDDTFTVAPRVPTRLEVLSNDTDRNGQPLSIVNLVPWGTSYGNFQVTPDGRAVLYTATTVPAPGQVLTQTFSYAAGDGTSGNNNFATATLTVRIADIIPLYSTSSNYQSLFSGLANGGIGMRDGDLGVFGPPSAYVTTHGTENTSNQFGGQFVVLDLGSSIQLSGFALAPIAGAVPAPFDLGALNVNGGYVSYSPDGINWYPADNISRAVNGAHSVFTTDDMFVRYLGISKLPTFHLGLGDVQLIGVGSGSTGFSGASTFGAAPSAAAASEKGVDLKPKAVPLFRAARFEKYLDRERLKARGQLASASLPSGGVQIPDAIAGQGGFSPPSSSRAGAAPPSQSEAFVPTERLASRYTASSALSAAFAGLDKDGMRDGFFSGIESTHQTSISSSEYVIAEFETPVDLTRIDVASATGPGASPLSDAELEVSSDCQRWVWVKRLTDTSAGGYVSTAVQASNVKCVRIQVHGAYLTLGDFRFF